MSLDAAKLALLVGAAKSRLSRDPLASFDWPGEPHKMFVQDVADGYEAAIMAANNGAKTYTGAALTVAIARGLHDLGGVRLPVVPVPNVSAVAVRSYDQQVDSSQAAILHWLGDYPHDIGWINKARRLAGTIFVATPKCAHGSGENCSSCSRIVFVSQENADRVLGARWNGAAWGDEPPIQSIWQEMRKNCRVRYVTYTPLAYSEWAWLSSSSEAGFPEPGEPPRHGRIRRQAHLNDNKFLSDARKRELVESYAGDPFATARITGAEVDAEGATPWGDLGFARLQELLAGCMEPELYEFPLAAAHRSAEKAARLEVFHEPEADESYYLVVDGSMGIADEDGVVDGSAKGRDPSAIHVYARRRPRLCAVYEGYLVPQVVGRLGAKVARMYGEVLVDVEDQGGYGEAVLIGFRDEGWQRFVMREKRQAQGGGVVRAYGFKTDSVTRALYIGAVQEQVLHGGIEVRSRRVVKSALGMRVDNNGKILARSGLHDEHVMLWGRAAHWMGLPANAPRSRTTTPLTGRRGLFDELRKDVEKARKQVQPTVKPRVEPNW